ncbi:MAG: universal stress protein [Methylocystaceae bacterium]|nr:MAG: universal stress protein [Methylocystaceae bacterium]
MPRILCATDFSLRSRRALRRAALLARRSAAELTLVHVVDDDQPEELIELERREADKFLKEQVASLAELQNLPCRLVVATGEAFDGVLRTARNPSADLIVMGTHRKQLLRDTFIGTTLERVIRTGPFPVLMVNREAERPYGGVLAAVDMSEPSARAITTAEALGLLDGVDVTIVHAFIALAKGQLFVANTPRAQIDEYIADERLNASMTLSSFLAAHGLCRPGWSLRLEEGDAFQAIARVAKELAPDLVVIGTHGRSGVAKMLLGSVAEQTLRSLDVDILAAPLGQSPA